MKLPLLKSHLPYKGPKIFSISAVSWYTSINASKFGTAILNTPSFFKTLFHSFKTDSTSFLSKYSRTCEA